jgi:hypothetical protein
MITRAIITRTAIPETIRSGINQFGTAPAAGGAEAAGTGVFTIA